MKLKISEWLYNKWIKFAAEIQVSENIPPIELLQSLLSFSLEIGKTENNYIKDLYNTYLSLFKSYDLKQYNFDIKDLWYSLDEVIKFDILEFEPKSDENIMLNIRDIIWNMIVFKSDIDCPICLQDDLRVFIEKTQKEIYFECDNCNNFFDKNFHTVKHFTELAYINSDIVKENNLSPSVLR